jgi:hypothetical protein
MLSQYTFSQPFYYYGISGTVRDVLLGEKQTKCIVILGRDDFSPVSQAGIGHLDLITAIDGKPVSEDWRNTLKHKPSAVFSIRRLGNQSFDTLLTGVPVLSDNYAHELDYTWYRNFGWWYRNEDLVEISDDKNMEIMSDPYADLYGYATFDFEFTDNNALQQKEIAHELEPLLIELNGLKRDRENPDMLIFIEFYSDRRDQYVPPSQQVSTRYSTDYNFITKKYETKQYVESRERGNYTITDYFTKLSISMADARKMRAGGKGPFTIWQADYEAFYKQKQDHIEFGGNAGACMLGGGFPFKSVKYVKFFEYWITGILYDCNIPGRVAGVIPNSPADKAGIKPGDMIKKCSVGNNRLFKKSFINLRAKANNSKDLFKSSRESNYRLFAIQYYRKWKQCPYNDTYIHGDSRFHGENYYDTHSSPVFTVENSNKEKRKVTITPIFRYSRFYGLE